MTSRFAWIIVFSARHKQCIDNAYNNPRLNETQLKKLYHKLYGSEMLTLYFEKCSSSHGAPWRKSNFWIHSFHENDEWQVSFPQVLTNLFSVYKASYLWHVRFALALLFRTSFFLKHKIAFYLFARLFCWFKWILFRTRNWVDKQQQQRWRRQPHNGWR